MSQLSEEQIQRIGKRLCDEFDRLFIVASKAQFKKRKDLTIEEKYALDLMNTTFGGKLK